MSKGSTRPFFKCYLRNSRSDLVVVLGYAALIFVFWPHAVPTEEYTSSTAQGGGGSFKDRKPIGELGGCESRMAEQTHRWIERWLGLCFVE